VFSTPLQISSVRIAVSFLSELENPVSKRSIFRGNICGDFGAQAWLETGLLSINNTNGSDRNNKFAVIDQGRLACRQLGVALGRRFEPPLSPALAGCPE
jgi:hypothetical protein